MGGWGCPHEVKGECLKIPGELCDPGMKGCVLAGRFRFSDTTKNRPGGVRKRAYERDTREPPPAEDLSNASEP